MEEVEESIITKLAAVASVKHADEEWGQLDYYGQRPPVKFPCALVDASRINYSNIGTDKTATPINRQLGEAVITITFANLKLTNSSSKAPQAQKDHASSIKKVIEDCHKVLHGFKPLPNCGALIRTGLQRVKRDDGIQEYEVTYSVGANNI